MSLAAGPSVPAMPLMKPPGAASLRKPNARIVVADANRIGCELLEDALRRNRFEVVRSTTTSDELIQTVTTLQPDVAVVSCHLQEGSLSGLRALRAIRAASVPTRVIILMDETSRAHVVDAFRAGAKGVFRRSESIQRLRRCISAVHKGQIWASSTELEWLVDALATPPPPRVVNAKGEDLLTPREQQVLQFVMEGMMNREVAQRLGLSEHTIKNYLFRIFDKLGISSRVELVLYALSRAA